MLFETFIQFGLQIRMLYYFWDDLSRAAEFGVQIESILQVEGQPRAPSCAARPQTALVSTACAQRCCR